MTGNNINEADKLRKLRAEALLGLRMASEKTGISAMRISQIECGKGDPLSKPEKDRLEKIYLDAIEAKRDTDDATCRLQWMFYEKEEEK